jgi:hypothetical protein
MDFETEKDGTYLNKSMGENGTINSCSFLILCFTLLLHLVLAYLSMSSVIPTYHSVTWKWNNSCLI